MKIFLIFCFCFSFYVLEAQDTTSIKEPTEFEIIKPSASVIVNQHKDNLQLTLIIDSIQIEDRTIRPNFKKTIRISYESDYIQVNDSLYIKIFIARNQEYGSKFYSWKWDYLKKRKSGFVSQGISSYEQMDFNGSLDANKGMGHGVGIEGARGFIMYYYRYKIE